ncbi:hypothetical protein HY993_00860 [Candidatus Micrarchaeota archaeon]|nr:hypothetical protein [Candidatus Micrarchaeota archaeon]
MDMDSVKQVHKSQNDLPKALIRLEREEKICLEDKALVKSFCNTWLAKGCKKARIVKLLYVLRRLSVTV